MSCSNTSLLQLCQGNYYVVRVREPSDKKADNGFLARVENLNSPAQMDGSQQGYGCLDSTLSTHSSNPHHFSDCNYDH